MNSKSAILKRHLFDGMAAGLLLGLVHAFILMTGGLFVLSSPAEVAASFARCAGLLGFTGMALGAIVGLFLAMPTRFRAVSYWSLRPAWAAIMVFYAAPWIAFLTKHYLGRRAVAIVGLACAAITVVLILIAVNRLGRHNVSRRRFRFVPGMGLLGVLIGICALLYGVAAFVPPDDEVREGKLAGLALGDTAPLEVGGTFKMATASFPASRWNLLLLTIDTLRADHLRCYGYARNTSPALDALAKSGVRFTHALCQRPKTSPSFATIMTGTYPARHGIHNAMQELKPANRTIAEYLGEAGWTTAAVITNGNLYPAFGFDQGFGTYVYGHKDAKTGTDHAIKWLEQNAASAEPWFLWVHHTDPHTPYSPPAPYDTMFGHDDERQRSATERQIDLYDGEIRFTVDQMGRLIEWITANGLSERTLIVFTADHGESLGEHNYYYEHGLHPYEPSARIPLIVAAAGVVPKATTSSALVGTVDILPTILGALDVDFESSVQGRSFLSSALGDGDAEPNDFVFIEAGYDEHDLAGRTIALRRNTMKYVHRLTSWARRPRGLGSFIWTMDARLEGGLAPDELYDLRTDPAETVNLLISKQKLALNERKVLKAFAELLANAGNIYTDGKLTEFDEETYKALRSLGYIK
jgi:arylsulfatase A-like enzyme